MNTFRRFAVLVAVLSAAACSSSIPTGDELRTPEGRPSLSQQQPTPSSSATAADSAASRGGGNLMGGN
jgi:hypothetical protein